VLHKTDLKAGNDLILSTTDGKHVPAFNLIVVIVKDLHIPYIKKHKRQYQNELRNDTKVILNT